MPYSVRQVTAITSWETCSGGDGSFFIAIGEFIGFYYSAAVDSALLDTLTRRDYMLHLRRFVLYRSSESMMFTEVKREFLFHFRCRSS
ncbi:unnamed protein product [Larinioides sclopetarius]|uniref:Uncharacterized protein n=1 Tax=Larinioides sclopetarius TaxID=280406 RepID=A0AAV1ZLZ6_9ARAC